MKKIIIVCIGLLPCFFSVAQTSYYQKTFGGTGNDLGFGITTTPDGGYAMAGYSNSFGAANTDILLIRFDHDGNLQWSRMYGGPLAEEASKILLTNDNGFVICGKTASYGAGGTDAYLMKTDSAGNVQWMKTYGGPADELMFNMRQTSDNGFLLAGSTQSFGQGNWDMMYIKTDSMGDTLWTKIIGGPIYDEGTDATETDSGEFVLLGRTMSFGSGTTDVMFIKLDANTDTLWTRAYGGTGWDEGMKVKQTPDGGYIITGGSNSFTSGNYDPYLIKVDSIGHVMWSKDYYGDYPDATYDVLLMNDGGYLLMGETESFGSNHQFFPNPVAENVGNDSQLPHILGTDNSNVFVIRTDSAGDTLWTRAYGGPLQDEGYSIVPAADNGFVAGAYSRSFTNDSIDFFVIKADSNGFSGCNEEPGSPIIVQPATVEMDVSPEIISGLIVDTVSPAMMSPAAIQTDLCFTIITPVTEQSHCGSPVIFPNPTHDHASLMLPACYKSYPADIFIYDISGRLMSRQHIQPHGEINMQTEMLSQGFYTVKVVSDMEEGFFTAKLIKQ